MHEQALKDALQKSGKSGETAKPARVKHMPYAKSDFAPAKKRLMVDPFLASLTASEKDKQALLQVINLTFNEFEKRARKNNVAYAITFMVAVATLVSKGVQVGDAEAEELAASINDALAQTPAFVKASATDRQKLYEGCIVTAGLILTFQQVGAQTNDENTIKVARTLASQTLASLGAGEP